MLSNAPVNTSTLCSTTPNIAFVITNNKLSIEIEKDRKDKGKIVENDCRLF